MLFGRKQRLINRLLIVEDEPLVAFDLEHALTQADYQVVATVDRYRDAMAVIEAQPLDLILSDVRLTGERDGVDLARAVKPHGIRLMFVTASCPVDAPDLSIGCLAKPYGHRELLDALSVIDATLGGKKPRRLPQGLSLYAL
ncbi:response regulator [Sphingomonas colocasiae]|uniref:Response regulator n=1 Tax=Sphingomonas colocasiae TaxID=1848973 RepID=A0ABS7PKB8_9SPHN|nr:response regulator [Sphingomonas colocasiae]MBY8820937.1 response regulator [Sphingomonas colocasiae]